MKNFKQSDMMIAGGLVMILAVLILPVPTPLLDVMLVVSIAAGILVLLITIQITDSLQLSAFPSILLLLTLFRLSLNVATTRQILLNAFAGNVIQAFGDFVVGGNYVVGVVVFLILVIINFMVITKGSGRIAEVAARFTLDAMPGKQMSIDADLNAGLIDEKEAIRRRNALMDEADFYGAMDGASKFVRGDAVAGLVITAINIIGGFAIGMLQQNMSAGDSMRTYTLLTVGDGLVSQIPALIISTAAGMLVTRAASTQTMGEDVRTQLFVRPRPLLITGSILGGMALVPGLPFVPFLALGSAIGGMGWHMRNYEEPKNQREQPGKAGDLPVGKDSEGRSAAQLPEGRADVPEISALDIEIGFGLVALVDKNQGGKLLERIAAVRHQLAEELGFVLPPVNVRDNVRLKNNDYAIRVRGLDVANGTVYPGRWLAISSSGDVKMPDGIPVKEPAFGFAGWWISAGQKEAAEAKGLTVVDPTSVITTHLAETAKRHASDILTRQDVSDMIDKVKQKHASVVQELIPNRLTIGVVHRVLQHLLKERVSIRDMPVILETLSDHAAKTQDPMILAELCRRPLGGHICSRVADSRGHVSAIGLHPDLEGFLQESISRDNSELGSLMLPPQTIREITQNVEKLVKPALKSGLQPVIVCLPGLRPHFRRLLDPELNNVPVLSFAEIPQTTSLDMLGMVNAPRKEEKEAA